LTSYRDFDGDTWGGNVVHRCERAPQPGYLLRGGDCCDFDRSAHPGVSVYSPGADACGSHDWDCDGAVEQSSSCTSLGKLGSNCVTTYK
jgi:hypothetical protein